MTQTDDLTSSPFDSPVEKDPALSVGKDFQLAREHRSKHAVDLC